jgi:hypothetical protein
MLLKRTDGDTVTGFIVAKEDEAAFFKDGNKAEECFWAASFCARDAEKAKVKLLYQQQSDDLYWTLEVLLEKFHGDTNFGVISIPAKDDIVSFYNS